MGAYDGSPFFIERLLSEHACVPPAAAAHGRGPADGAQVVCTEPEASSDVSASQAFTALNEYAGRQLRMQLRMTFRLVDQFMRLRRLDFERPRLEGIVQDLLVVVRESFVTAGMCLPDEALIALDRKRCVHELEELSRSIGHLHAMPPPLLAHALDSVIVNCLILDSAQRDIEKVSQEVVAVQAS